MRQTSPMIRFVHLLDGVSSVEHYETATQANRNLFQVPGATEW